MKFIVFHSTVMIFNLDRALDATQLAAIRALAPIRRAELVR